jgi:3-isopropylmalate/(R)-2-methylmalate dehydratase small subunit
VRNGIVPVTLDAHAFADVGPLTIDLLAQTLSCGGAVYSFAIDTEAKAMLTGGLDAIDLTLLRATEIHAFRAADAKRRPWAYL